MAKNERKNIILTCIDKDKDVRVYEIDYKGQIITLQFYLRIKNDTLYLESLDIEGAGPNSFGPKMKGIIKEVAYEFCLEYKANNIVITGNRRSAGKTKGKFLSTMKLNFKKMFKKK